MCEDLRRRHPSWVTAQCPEGRQRGIGRFPDRSGGESCSGVRLQRRCRVLERGSRTHPVGRQGLELLPERIGGHTLPVTESSFFIPLPTRSKALWKSRRFFTAAAIFSGLP